MDLRAVDYFLAIAAHGSLRAAALRLGVSQPALTKAVRRLEDELGVVLLERGARGVTLTVYGEALLRHARNLRADLREATEELQALRLGIAGRVRLGAGPSWHQAVLPEALAAFRLERPDVRIQATGGMDEALKAQLRAGALDFVLAAVSDAPQLEGDLEGRALLADDYRVVASSDHPLRRRTDLALIDLLDFPWILPGPANYMVERLRVMFRALGLPPPEPVIETDIQSLKLILMRGSTYLSFHAAAQLADVEPEHIRPLEVRGAVWRRKAGIVTRRGVEPSPAAAALMRTIERVCAGQDHSLAGAA